MDGLEFIDNHLSICFSFYNFHLSTRLLFFYARRLWRCSDFLGKSQPCTRGGQFKTIYERASPFEPFLLLDAGVRSTRGIKTDAGQKVDISWDGLLIVYDQKV